MKYMDEISIVKKPARVDFINLGEGIWGDYDCTDSEDINLLRFDVYRWRNGDWEAIPDSSYCTQISANTDENKLTKLLNIIMDELHGPISERHSIKRICERLSWIDETGKY
jgi:hypothetical protein